MSNKTQSGELLPCPFCGAAAKSTYHNGGWPEHDYNVECGNWKCPSRSGGRASQGAAAALWNRRATTASAPAMDAEPVAEVVRAVWGRCEALEDEAYAKLELNDLTEHELGFWRAQKMTAKSIRRSTEMPTFAHPSDAESLRAEVTKARRFRDIARNEAVEHHSRAEKAEAELTTALARVKELEDAADRLADALRHGLCMLPRDCNQRLGMEGALRAYQPNLEIEALTPPPDADLDALVARLRGQDPIPSRNEVADAITALRARPVRVKVKPLVWDDNNHAEDAWGGYSVTDRPCLIAGDIQAGEVDAYGWSHCSRGDWDESEDTWETADAAKAAADADHAARIHAALEGGDA